MQIRDQVTESVDTYNKTADGELHYVGHSLNQGVMYSLNIRLFDITGGYVILCAAMRQAGAVPAPTIAKLFSNSQHYLQICVHRICLNQTVTVGNVMNV